MGTISGEKSLSTDILVDVEEMEEWAGKEGITGKGRTRSESSGWDDGLYDEP